MDPQRVHRHYHCGWRGGQDQRSRKGHLRKWVGAGREDSRQILSLGPQPSDIDDPTLDGPRVYRQEPPPEELPDATNSLELFLYQPYGCAMWVFSEYLDFHLARTEQEPPYCSVSLTSDLDIIKYKPGSDIHVPWSAKKPYSDVLGVKSGVILVEAYEQYATRLAAADNARIASDAIKIEDLETRIAELEAAAGEKGNGADGADGADDDGGDEYQEVDHDSRYSGARSKRNGYMPRLAKLWVYYKTRNWENVQGYGRHLERKFGDFKSLVVRYESNGVPRNV